MAMNQLELDRHHELAAFLRNRRARILPEQVGLPRGTRRRTPGLRRAEVALLAGVTPEWYSRLEQGRDIHVSVQLLESLASVLQLDADERTHLFFLALRQPPPVETFAPMPINPSIQQFLQQLGATPACVIDARLNIVEGNTAFRVVFGDCSTQSERARNMIWRLFTPPVLQEENEEWEKLARVFLAQFRAGYGRFINDPWWSVQIAELSRISPAFRELWSRHDVLNRPEGWKSIHHPLVGELTLDFFLLQPVDSSDLRLLIYSPRSNSGTAEKIERLLSCE
ncbi:transcriptional regulator [Dictyobacter sp. S3.2.2.5]|uniref:Transcriptional regulator n=1 Tax=Dictyobacter halimunensis TaxID=3026934 RepID=A0ABQ6G7A3_9CHLR|nr:transcriptional regulator [Dictyobacter sp. S3.2.2.5]